MKRDYYILWYRLDDKDSYLIWFSTENDDGVLVDKNGFVPSFNDVKTLRDYSNQKKIILKDEEPVIHNLELIENWLCENNSAINDYNEVLNTWNLFEDISISTNGNFNSDRELTKKIYEKIFWGCNIPAVTPEGESFTPTWTKMELKIVRETLIFGFQMFREKIKPQ